MTETLTMTELRDLFLTAPSGNARGIAIAGSLVLAGLVLWLVRRRKLREEYTPIWLGVALAITLVSVNQGLLGLLTRIIGAWTPSSTIFFFGEIFLLVICLNYAVRLSRITLDVKNLHQEIALLRGEIDGRRGGAV